METQNLQTLTAEQFADFIGVKIGTVINGKVCKNYRQIFIEKSVTGN